MEEPKSTPVPKTTAASKTPSVPRTTTHKPSSTGAAVPKTVKQPAKSTAQPQGISPDRPTAEKSEDTILPTPEKAPLVSSHIVMKKSKKLAKAIKKLKFQKKEIASLEKNRNKLMSELIKAIETKKKSKKIRSLARDLNRIDKKVNNRTASYMQANKKLTNKMKQGKS